MDECVSSPCANDGTCTEKVNGFTCKCVLGYDAQTVRLPVFLCHFYFITETNVKSYHHKLYQIERFSNMTDTTFSRYQSFCLQSFKCQAVNIYYIVSSNIFLNTGSPQGCVLSPHTFYQFTVYIRRRHTIRRTGDEIYESEYRQ